MEYSIQKFIKKRPKTKIVCTIGPSSSEVKTLKKMISEGMSVARLNLSHGTITQHKLYVENAKQAAQELDAPLGILIVLTFRTKLIKRRKSKHDDTIIWESVKSR